VSFFTRRIGIRPCFHSYPPGMTTRRAGLVHSIFASDTVRRVISLGSRSSKLNLMSVPCNTTAWHCL